MMSQLRHIVWVAVLFIVIGYHQTTAVQRRRIGTKISNKIEKKKGEKTKSVSSDKVHNGGRKGPMSGGSQGLPSPAVIPFPIIPLQGNGGTSVAKNKNKKKKKAQEAESGQKEYSVKDTDLDLRVSKKKKTRSAKKVKKDTSITRSSDKLLKRLKRSFEEDENGNVEHVFKESFHDGEQGHFSFKRSAGNDFDDLTEDEMRARDEWLAHEGGDNFLPGAENVYFSPSDLDFIWQGHSVLAKAYQTIMPSMRFLTKRSLAEEGSDDIMSINKNSEQKRDIAKRNVDELSNDDDAVDLMLMNAENNGRDMQTREVSTSEEEAEDIEEELDIVNEDKDFGVDYEEERDTREAPAADEPPSSVEEAERQLQNAELAAEALTHLEMKLGIDPEHLVSDTHKYVMSLQAEKAKYDADIRSHINKALDAEKRASIAVHDEVKKSEISGDVTAAKIQLEGDRNKIEEINTNLKQLKDIELMATGLEVAKLLAKERAQHNLAVAKENAARNPQPAQQAAPPAVPSAVAAINSQIESQPSAFDQFMPPEPVTSRPQPMYNAPQSSTPMTQAHQIGDQRNEESRPSFNTPPVAAPLTQYLSSYIQSQKAQANQFAAQPHWLTAASKPFYPPAPSLFHRPAPSLFQEQHVEGDQRHATAKAPPPAAPSMYMLRPPQSVTANVNLMTSFAKPTKLHGVGTPDHEITKIEQTHKLPDSDEERKDTENDHDSWGEVLSFPGTTYSPPPSWLQRQNEPDSRTQPARTQYQGYAPPSENHQPSFPYSQRAGFHPSITEVAGERHPNLGVAPFSTLHPYEPPVESFTGASPFHQFSQQSSLSAPSSASYTTSQPAPPPVEAVTPVQNVAHVAFNSPRIVPQDRFTEKEAVEMRPGSPMNYASPQNQQAQVGEVIHATPQDEVVTMNRKPEKQPVQQPPPDLSGNLPGWMGAVDSAKYDNDVSDRLRETNGSKPSVPPSDTGDQNVKREYLHLQKAQKDLQDTFKAASAVTHVESAVGFDPGSIAKMVDFVKTAAVKDVKLSKDTVEKDKETLRKIEGDTINKKSEIAKKSEVDSVALEHAKGKLKTDEAVLADAQDRLDKIQKMELIVTEIEVAKYYASTKAENEVRGAKRTLDALKRNEVTKPQ